MQQWLRQTQNRKVHAATVLWFSYTEMSQRKCYFQILSIVTARKRSLGQGNVFTGLCHSFCPWGGGGGWLPSIHHRSHDQGGLHLGGLPPWGICIQEGGLIPRGSASRGVGQTPLPQRHMRLWDMANKWAVCILLECILVFKVNVAQPYTSYLPHFHMCLFAHKLLEIIHLKDVASSPLRLQIIQLQKYDMTIKYRPGRKMLLADTLSRCPSRN